MKKMKKLFAVLLTLAMVLGMSMTSFAADETTNATVKISGADGATLKYVQIVEPDRGSKDGWKIVPGFEKAFTDAGLTIKDLLKNTPDTNAAQGKITSNTKLSALLESLRLSATTTTTTITENQFTATKGGLYLIIADKEGWTYAPMLAYVPVDSTADVNVTAKGEENQVRKEISSDGKSVAAGDIVKYTVNANYPFYSSNYEDVLFKVTDTLTNANFLIDDSHPVTVTIDGTPAASTEYTVSDSSNGTNKLSVDFKYDYTKAGTTVEITYYAKVSESVSSESPLKNKVTSETASTHNGTPTKTEYIVVSTPVKATIKKVDLTNSTITLKGAVFELHRVVNGKDTVVTTATTDDKGIATFDGLDGQDTTYYIVETQAPSGYKIDGIKHPLSGATANEPTINTVKDSETKITTITTTYTFTDFGDKGITTITNTKLSALPSTGGIGTTIFTIAGCLIMIAAAGLFFASRKKSDNK